MKRNEWCTRMKVGKAGGKEALGRIMRNGNKKETRMKREKKGIFLKPKKLASAAKWEREKENKRL